MGITAFRSDVGSESNLFSLHVEKMTRNEILVSFFQEPSCWETAYANQSSTTWVGLGCIQGERNGFM